MERKIGRYKVTTSAHVLYWSWNLLPSISIAFDEVGFYASFGFLCFSANLDIDDEIKEQEWTERIRNRFAALTDTEEDKGEDDGEQFSVN